MDLRIRNSESIRIYGDHEHQNFINIYGVGYESIAIDLFPSFHYIEIRKKEEKLRIFTFPKKSLKKECDFGWWEDAEVIYAINKVLNS